MTQIERLRVKAKLSQTELALQTGVTQGAVSQWEKGTFPTADKLPLIAKALSCSIDELFSLNPDNN